jgi:hypothetical protein
MPHSEFTNPKLTQHGALEVGGPFAFYPGEEQQIIGEVVVRFLLMQERENQADEQWQLEGVAGLTSQDTWGTVVPRDDVPPGLRVGVPNKTRGIALAVVLKKQDPPSPKTPPYFETITWCVTIEIDDERESSAA